MTTTDPIHCARQQLRLVEDLEPDREEAGSIPTEELRRLVAAYDQVAGPTPLQVDLTDEDAVGDFLARRGLAIWDAVHHAIPVLTDGGAAVLKMLASIRFNTTDGPAMPRCETCSGLIPRESGMIVCATGSCPQLRARGKLVGRPDLWLAYDNREEIDRG